MFPCAHEERRHGEAGADCGEVVVRVYSAAVRKIGTWTERDGRMDTDVMTSAKCLKMLHAARQNPPSDTLNVLDNSRLWWMFTAFQGLLCNEEQ